MARIPVAAAEPATESQGTNITVLSDDGPADYDRLERNAIRALNRLLEETTVTKLTLTRAKLAQGALASVQSFRKAQLGRRGLDFAIARALTSDPARLAEYVRRTQHDSGLLEALPSGETTDQTPAELTGEPTDG